MKRGAGLLTIILFLLLIPFKGTGQITCIYDKNISDFTTDQWCSPVTVVYWTVTYTSVVTGGGSVSIRYNWGDGVIQVEPASEGPAGTFTATLDHTYYSDDNVCKYFATASLDIDGEVCENTTVEKNVPVWDVDNENGAYVNASPDVYPICIGNGATMRFNDDTRYNCVPPQEDDIRNESTRWIQWVYGTNSGDANFMSGTPVSVDGYTGPWPYVTPVKELPGPSWGSSERSLPITVDDDKLLGEEFEVELRYWNYCNPYPGNDPVTDRSVIRIVDLPLAEIEPVDTLCEFNPSIILDLKTGSETGGTWSGNGIIDASTGEFSPSVAGPGTHTITYTVTDGNSCSNSGTVNIVVRDAPDGTITPVDPFCIYDAPYVMETVAPAGTWYGTGIDPVTGLFDPSDAGIGSHEIIFNTLPDNAGCFGTDTVVVHVVDIPSAEFLTPDSAWCIQPDNHTTAKILITGSDTSEFDLVLEIRGTLKTLSGLPSDTFDLYTDNLPGRNEYHLVKVIEHHGSNSCENEVNDTLVMEVKPKPDMSVTASYDLCTPVEVQFQAVPGPDNFYWNFGDNDSIITQNEIISHTYSIKPEDQKRIRIDTLEGIIDTTHYEVFIRDSTFHYRMVAESSFGCRDTLYDSITIYNQPVADFFVSPEIQNYPESDVFLINLSSYGSWSYLWDYGDNMNDTVKEPNNHTYETYGFYDISLMTYNEFCSDTITKKITIMPPPPVAEFEPDSIGCPPLSITFNNTSMYADSYIWDFDDGRFSTEKNPTHSFYESKEHHVTLAAFGLSGTDTVEQIVFIYDTPQALFTAYPLEAKSLNQVFTFTNNSIGAVNYMWDFGDGATSPEEEPIHVYREEGTFDVTLYAWTENDCVDTIFKESMINVVAGEGEANFPNAFVWTGAEQTDGSWTEENINNNIFHPQVVNGVKFRMQIYTRWGELIWETNELYKGWDGYLKTGELASPGVYVYIAWVTYISGEEKEYRGDVTFLH